MKAKIKDIYTYVSSNNLKIFGDVSSFPFMAEYSDISEAFDFLFNKKFSSFYYFNDFAKGSTLESVYNDFTRAIRSFFYFNSKRYTELYRVEVLALDSYNIVNNYDLTETSTSNSSGTTNATKGARIDSDTYGTKAHTDIYGERRDNTEVSNGVQGSSTEKEIAGYNSSKYVDSDKETTTINANTSGGTSTKGVQTDTHSEASYTDGHSIGAQTDSGTSSGSESVNLRRYGNIGVQTAAEIIGGHVRLWESFSFYDIIFRDLSREFLLVDDDYLMEAGDAISENDVADIMTKLNSIQAQLTADTAQIREDISNVEVDDTTVITAVNNARDNIKANDNANTSSLRLDMDALSASLLSVEDSIKSNDNSNTSTIRSDITGVETNGY